MRNCQIFPVFQSIFYFKFISDPEWIFRIPDPVKIFWSNSIRIPYPAIKKILIKDTWMQKKSKIRQQGLEKLPTWLLGKEHRKLY